VRIGIASGDRIGRERSPDGLPHWGGAGWVRLAQYIPLLSDGRFKNITEVYEGTLVWHYNCFKITTDDKSMHDVDIVIVQRLMHDGLSLHIHKAKVNGQIVINDVDDWYWGLDPSNMAWKASHPKYNKEENTKFYREIISASSLVTVSTPFLQNKIKEWNVQSDVVIIPNTVDTARFAEHDHTNTTTPVVGWVGSTAHRSGDLEILRGILTTTQNYKLMHAGYSEYAPKFANAVNVPEDSVTLVPAVDPENYPDLLQMDIGIAPLRECAFNRAKSEIKLLEYSACGIPWIASQLDAYETLRNEFGVGRIARRPKDWLRHIKALTSDWQLRRDEGLQLRELVTKRDIAVGAENWNDVLNSL
jgi:glycosyltransferase involved in cell wall biosynthesis